VGGLRLALTLFTVAPLRADRFDRPTARVAMALAPLVGALLGLVLALVGVGLRAVGAAPLLAGAILVGLGVLLTRGLHIDGLADTADGLGSYGAPEKALEIMKKSDIGPFGVAAIVVVLLIDTAAATSLLGPGSHTDTQGQLKAAAAALSAVAAAFAAGRLGATIASRRGMPPARPDGLGALVAGTVSAPLLLAAAGGTAALAALADPWRGPLAVAAAVTVAWLLTNHARRRLGGITGDVIGGTIELSTMTALIVLATG
jgi:adenosylcobinamide-GDP ribazoletransferase